MTKTQESYNELVKIFNSQWRGAMTYAKRLGYVIDHVEPVDYGPYNTMLKNVNWMKQKKSNIGERYRKVFIRNPITNEVMTAWDLYTKDSHKRVIQKEQGVKWHDFDGPDIDYQVYQVTSVQEQIDIHDTLAQVARGFRIVDEQTLDAGIVIAPNGVEVRHIVEGHSYWPQLNKFVFDKFQLYMYKMDKAGRTVEGYENLAYCLDAFPYNYELYDMATRVYGTHEFIERCEQFGILTRQEFMMALNSDVINLDRYYNP